MARLLIRYFHLNGGGCFHLSGRIDADKGLTPVDLTFQRRRYAGQLHNNSALHSNYCGALQRETALQLDTIYGIFDHSIKVGVEVG